MRRYLKRLIEHFPMSEAQREIIDFDLLEAKLNEYFSKAHSYYLKTVKKDAVDYKIYKGSFLMLIRLAEEKGCIPEEWNSQLAFMVVKHSLTEKEDLVCEYFENNPSGDYCRLLRYTMGSKYLHELQGNNFKNGFLKSLNGQLIPSCSAARSEGLTLRAIPEDTIRKMTDFVNYMCLFRQKLTVDEFRDFLDCKAGVQIMANNNNQLCLFLLMLSKYSYAKKNWASIIAKKQLLRSSTGMVITDSHNLTSPANRLFNKPKEMRNCEENEIFRFMETISKGM